MIHIVVRVDMVATIPSELGRILHWSVGLLPYNKPGKHHRLPKIDHYEFTWIVRTKGSTCMKIDLPVVLVHHGPRTSVTRQGVYTIKNSPGTAIIQATVLSETTCSNSHLRPIRILVLVIWVRARAWPMTTDRGNKLSRIPGLYGIPTQGRYCCHYRCRCTR